MATADRNRPGRGAPVHETRHGFDAETPISATIIDAVAAAAGVDPTDRDLQLYDAVDLDALDALFERRSVGDRWRFEFGVREYAVVIEGDGRVAVYDRG